MARVKNRLYLPTQKEKQSFCKKWELSSAGSEHLPYKQRVTGSNPVAPTGKMKGLQEFKLVSLFSFAQDLHKKGH